MTVLKASEVKPAAGGPSFSLAHRLRRLLWQIAWLLLARWTPPFLYAWRRFLLRLFGATIASEARVYSSARIWYPPNLIMLQNACIGPRVNLYCMARVSLGRGALVSQDSTICAGSHDYDDQFFQLIASPITIGDGAWVAAEAFVGPGVTIGPRAVLGARAVMFKDAEPCGIYAGNPAKLIKRRTLND